MKKHTRFFNHSDSPGLLVYKCTVEDTQQVSYLWRCKLYFCVVSKDWMKENSCSMINKCGYISHS